MSDAGSATDQAHDRGPEGLVTSLVAAPRAPRGRQSGLRAFLDGIEDGELRAGLVRLIGTRSQASRLLGAVLGHSPFLARILANHPDWLHEALAEEPGRHLDRLIGDMWRAGTSATHDDEIMPALRHGRQRVALLVALADLGGIWGLAEVTEALTRLADAAVALAADHVLRGAHRAGRLTLPDPARPGEGSGYVLIAMGKHGARELNYSSDVDLIALHDPARAPAAESVEPDALLSLIHI